MDDVIVTRFQPKATERLINENPAVARLLCDTRLRDLANAHGRTLLLGRMTAPERVASFSRCSSTDDGKVVVTVSRFDFSGLELHRLDEETVAGNGSEQNPLQ